MLDDYELALGIKFPDGTLIQPRLNAILLSSIAERKKNEHGQLDRPLTPDANLNGLPDPLESLCWSYHQ